MTTSTLQTPARTMPHTARFSPRRPAGRMTTVVVLICSLVCTAVMKEWAAFRQEKVSHVRDAAASRSALGNMDSFALALLLGGLRGPLVMFLWPAIEGQKADHNLEDIDTMINWVRLLQPEFDSVLMFQVWNKAYNISAMMASSANKYTVVMDALEFAASANNDRPGDVNILRAIQDVYGGKLGSTALAEFPFYSRQFREESMTETNRKAVYPDDKTYLRLGNWDPILPLSEQKPILGEDNRIRPDLLKPTRERPADKAADAEWNDGSELQYLKTYEPFPYGMSPLAMSYNYAKRAEVALAAEGQRTLQSTPMVIDSQPALSLRFWAEDDARHGRIYEGRGFGVREVENLDFKLMTIKPSTKPVRVEAVQAAIFHYNSAQRLAGDAIKEYRRHLAKPEYGSWRFETYRSHIAEMFADVEFFSADRDYLQAILTTDSATSRSLLDSASRHYDNAILDYERIVLANYMEDSALWRAGVMPAGAKHEKLSVLNLTDEQVKGTPGNPGVFDKAMRSAGLLRLDERDHDSERASYQSRVDRCRARINMINPSAIPLRPADFP